MQLKPSYLFASLLLLASCHKDKPTTPPPPPAPATATDNFHLIKGSYWVYQVYTVDTLNNYTPMASLDSNYIHTDTVIRGKTYHIMAGTYFNITFLTPSIYADSSGWLTDDTGRKLFDFNEITNVQGPDTLNPSYIRTTVMLTGSQLVTVPAGSFTCQDAQTTAYDPLTTNSWQKLRHVDRKYAQGKGLIWETAFYSSVPSHMERRLLRYHLN
jgi:hypothetical protein